MRVALIFLSHNVAVPDFDQTGGGVLLEFAQN
jgi:hypothetical protein